MLAKNSSFPQHHFNGDIYVSKCNYLQYMFRFDGYYMYSFLLVLMLNIALSLLTSFTDIIIIHVIFKNNRVLNTPSISLYVYTTFADLFLSIIGLPLWISYQIHTYYRKAICILYEILTFITHYFAIVSFFLVLLLSADRYIVIFKPFFYEEKIKPSNRIYRHTTTVIFLLVFLVVSVTKLLESHIMLNIFEALNAIIILFIDCFIYIIIYCKARQINDMHKKRMGKKYSSISPKYEKKLVKSTLLIVLSLYLCYTPHVIKLILDFTNILNGDAVYTIGSWSFLLIAPKSLLNPLLYCYSLKVVCSKVFESLRCCSCKKANLAP